MSKQLEPILEEQLIDQLKKTSYRLAVINSEKELLANLKAKLKIIIIFLKDLRRSF
jgi:hypothetical protein